MPPLEAMKLHWRLCNFNYRAEVFWQKIPNAVFACLQVFHIPYTNFLSFTNYNSSHSFIMTEQFVHTGLEEGVGCTKNLPIFRKRKCFDEQSISLRIVCKL